jgi:hypothetical protein
MIRETIPGPVMLFHRKEKPAATAYVFGAERRCCFRIVFHYKKEDSPQQVMSLVPVEDVVSALFSLNRYPGLIVPQYMIP